MENECMNMNDDMDIRTQIAKHFNVPWAEIEIIPLYYSHDVTGRIRFKLDKQLLFNADINKRGIIKNIRAD
jgi:hypothetical protein